MLEVAQLTRSSAGRGQDRTASRVFGLETWLVLADGAGGVPGGEDAAQGFVDTVLASGGGPDLTSMMRAADTALAQDPRAGLTTGIVAVIGDGMIWGASVGDSGVWLIQPNGCLDLTSHQSRKPLLGSGSANVAAFGPERLDGTLLLASDGLLNYAPAKAIAATVRALPAPRSVEALTDLVRLPNGALQDDVSVLLASER